MVDTIKDILNIEGIVIRLIPKVSISMYSYNEHNKKLLSRDNTTLAYSDYHKRDMIKETRVNSLGGKYLVTMEYGQGSTVMFNKRTCGVGDTLEEAYEAYRALD